MNKLPPKLDKAKKEGDLLVKTVDVIGRKKKKLVVIVVVALIILAAVIAFDSQ